MRISAVAPLALACLALAACQSESTGPSAAKASSMDGRARAFVATPCADCVFGPRTYTRVNGGPQVITETVMVAAAGQYSVDIDDLGTTGGDGSVELNGVTLMAKRLPGQSGPRHVVVEVTLGTSNNLVIRLTGKKGSQLQVSIRSLCDIGPLPNPELQLERIEQDVVVGPFLRDYYELNVGNSASFPDAMFVQSPELPPCDTNTTSSRTWVKIFVNGSQYFGFCALDSGASLNQIWFAWDPDTPPPTSVYIELVDRKCGITYTSNQLALPAPQ
jgi:hypothetical protein